MNKVTIPIKDFEAVIFDMDGTMVNNTAHHQQAWQEYLKKHGVNLSDEEFHKKISGKKNDHIAKLIFGDEASPEDIKRVGDDKEALYRELYKDEIEEVSGLSEFINKLQDLEIPIAIATTAPLLNRKFLLSSLGLEGRFKTILGDEHVAKGKPDPEIYLSTAKSLEVKPEKCLVFDDSLPGARAAKSAGMTVVALLTSQNAENLPEADYTVNDFSEVELG
jgi:beta-phosphoglucomutase